MNQNILPAYIEEIRLSKVRRDDVPSFDPKNGNEQAKFLIVLEAPGPQAINSGIISIENDDPTARNLRKLLDEAKIHREEVVIWNVVPWYVGNENRTQIAIPSAEDVEQGIGWLCKLVGHLKHLQCILLVGGSARKAHIRLSARTKVRILACHHTSQRVLNISKVADQENRDVFQFMRA